MKKGTEVRIIRNNGEHSFEVGQIVSFIGVNEIHGDWYVFEDENGKAQDLVIGEFELIK